MADDHEPVTTRSRQEWRDGLAAHHAEQLVARHKPRVAQLTTEGRMAPARAAVGNAGGSRRSAGRAAGDQRLSSGKSAS